MNFLNKLLGRSSSLRSLTRPLRKRASHLTRLRLARMKRPRLGAKIIAITGSSGKSTTTILTSRFLESRYSTREQVYRNAISACVETILHADPGDEFLVIETGAGQVGTVVEMAGLLKPDIAVVTMVAVEHRSAFKNVENIAREKGALVEAIADGGLAVLNVDDENVMAMASRTKQRIVTFGRVNEADYRVVDIERSSTGTMELSIVSRLGTHRLSTNLLGTHFWPSVAAAFAVAVENGIPPETVARTITTVETGRNRCQRMPIENGPTFIVDTVKAPLSTLQAAFDVIRPLDAPRKRIVLAMIADYPGNSTSGYRKAYKMAAENADQVIFVGEHAHRHKASAEDIAAGRIVEMPTVEQAHAYLRETAIPGEIIFLKSSGVAHLERLALAFAGDVKCWKERCGLNITCQGCGLFEYPFEDHARIGRQRRKAKRAQKKTDTVLSG